MNRLQCDEAITYYQKALQLNPSDSDVYDKLGDAFQENGQLDEAISCFKKAIQLDTDNPEAYNCLFNAENGKLYEAAICYQKALQINPDFKDAFNKLMSARSKKANKYLNSGNFEKGWQELWNVQDILTVNSMPLPLWQGSDIKGLTIFLHTGWGFGDTIQFVRYIPLVAKRGAKVIFACFKELASLLRTVEGVHHLIIPGDPIPEAHIHSSILRLPLIFGTTPESIPAKVPYISVEPLLLEKWRSKFEPRDRPKFKVGLVWKGNPTTGWDSIRSCSIDLFSSIANIDNITFYSLQKGEAAKETKNLHAGMNLIDYTEEIQDFSDTAALIENLDLVISVDTAVAHLAGALGKPVWTLLPFSPDWRWLPNREESLWYPTMKLFRQPAAGDWESVISKVSIELQKKVIGIDKFRAR